MATRDWPTARFALAVHDRQLAEHGGRQGVRDRGLLESALARPQQKQAYSRRPDIAGLAASLCYGIVRNVAFADGNKRTALVCCEAFLEWQGWTLVASDIELYPVVLGLAAGEIGEAEFADWLRLNIRRVSGQPRESGGAARSTGNVRKKPSREEVIAVAERIMREDRGLLRKLADN